MFFLFQAEDGIRDLVRSRGLGDVYKRQEYSSPTKYLIIMNDKTFRIKDDSGDKKMATGGNKLFQQISQITADCIRAVSYTHLTLPTSDLV